MCRIIKNLGAKDEVYGVLTDYGLSSWAASLKTDYTKTPQQSGTPPYVAKELLVGTSDVHLYRHDVESLFYVMLLTCAHHEFDRSGGAKWSVVIREGILPYQKWFNQQHYEMLGSLKGSFFFWPKAIELSPAFEDFHPWLQDLRFSFTEGFVNELLNLSAQEGPSVWRRKRAGWSSHQVMPPPVPFDDETLGGHVHYSAVIEPTRYLKGELTGLKIRYDPPSPPLPPPTDAVHADA